MDPVIQQIEKHLAAPFDASEVKWKAQAVNGNRALAVAYVDARAVQDRLDEVCGMSGWQDYYEVLSDGSVVCKLQLRIGGEWITKVDVGGQSEQSDEGDRRKAAFSDALKRAAVKFGVGRYLYRLPSQWVDYDAHKKRFVSTPKLPASAIVSQQHTPVARASAALTGAQLMERELKRQDQLAKLGRCSQGELIAYLRKQASLLGCAHSIPNWPDDIIKHASDWIRVFLADHPEQPQANGTPAQPPPAAAPTRYVTPERARAMADLCARKGIGWSEKGPGQKASVCGSRGWARSRMIEDLSQTEYEQLWQDLQAERDREPAAVS